MPAIEQWPPPRAPEVPRPPRRPRSRYLLVVIIGVIALFAVECGGSGSPGPPDSGVPDSVTPAPGSPSTSPPAPREFAVPPDLGRRLPPRELPDTGVVMVPGPLLSPQYYEPTNRDSECVSLGSIRGAVSRAELGTVGFAGLNDFRRDEIPVTIAVLSGVSGAVADIDRYLDRCSRYSTRVGLVSQAEVEVARLPLSPGLAEARAYRETATTAGRPRTGYTYVGEQDGLTLLVVVGPDPVIPSGLPGRVRDAAVRAFLDGG